MSGRADYEKRKELENKLKYVEKLENNLGHKLPMGNEVRKSLETLQKLEDEEQKRLKYKDYLKAFDEAFNTTTQEKIKEISFLIHLFDEFADEIYKPNELHKLAIHTKIEIDDVLLPTLTDEQKYLLEQNQFCEDRISNELAEQAFVYGYAMASQSKEEAIKQYPRKDNS